MASSTKQESMKLSKEDVELLNTPVGMRFLFADKKIDLRKALRLARYETELRELQTELIKLQNWVIENKKKVVVLFEGRDAAGKGGAIRRITAHINPRYYRVVALPKPTEEEVGQWYFQRYVIKLPKAGEIVFFDRSWYNRAILEPVNGFCTEQQYESFMNQVNDFERMIQESDTYLIKFYFSITKEEQARRFKDIKSSPLKKWKMSPVDANAQPLWDEYTKYKVKMMERTDIETSPWITIKADQKSTARIEAARYLLDTIPYE